MIILLLKCVFHRLDASANDGTLGRLINDDHSTPNAVARVVECGGNPCICFFSVNAIAVGTEIRYNYGKNIDFWWRVS